MLIKEIEYYLSHNSNCDLLCFGEDYLHGFHSMSWEYTIDIKRAIEINSKAIKEIQELAKNFNCAISFGYIERSNDKIYCSNIIIDNYGGIVDNYRRISEGQAFQVFELNGKWLVTAICGDIWSDYRDI